MGIAAELLDCGRVDVRDNQPLGQLCNRAELITSALEVLVSGPGRQPEVVNSSLTHGVQDIASLFFDLMTDRDDSHVGLCATCNWVRIVTNRRGSVFYRCLRADTDPRFLRYPPLPVQSCPGYERRTPSEGAELGGDHKER